MISTFSFPTLIHFGNGARFEVTKHLKAQKLSRPFIVTDRGMAPLPILSSFRDDLAGDGLKPEIFSGVHGNPDKAQVTEGVAAFKKSGADSIIGFGGGAALDVAKAIALMIHHPGDLFDYEDGKPDGRAIDREIPYLVALPTTSGTGSEVGRSSVISDPATHLKKIIFSPRLLAKAVFADPELTMELPPKITAATGMDALTHCVESYLAKGYHPMCDGIALEGVRISAKFLARAVHNGNDIEARGGMMMASLMGAVAFQKGLGLTHSCAHSLSTVADLHHGLANGVMIDFALKLNLNSERERFAILAGIVGRDSFLDWLRDLKREVGIPAKLSEVGIKPEQIETLAKFAFLDSCHQNNPVACKQEDFLRIFREAM